MKQINKDLSKYYRSISKGLLGGFKDKRRMLADLKCRVNDFLADNPNAKINNIEKHFGTPQSIYEEFNACLTGDEVKGEKSKKTLKHIALGVSIAAAIAVIVAVVYIIVKTEENKTVYVEYDIKYDSMVETIE
ncbi:MAG: DUF6120 family protein [Clostridia bacterium]|nr:DUF6120 family protein [Clostridia bacterium]